MKRIASIFCSAVFSLSLTGCAMVAPQYPSSLDNVSALKKDAGSPARVATFDSHAGKGNANPISLRGNTMASPYQDSYANYLAEALKQELTLAGKYSGTSPIEISGTLLKNDVDAAGFVTGYGNIEARLMVKNRDVVKYDKVKSVKHEWESGFSGGTAIPRALAEYPLLVSKLLAAVYADPEFMEALK